MAMISAHRGGGEYAPLATLDAYKRAADTGAEYVELDIRRTRDGELVAFHDERPRQGAPPVAALEHRQLCELAGYQVPLAGEVLELLARGVTGHLDLKETGYEDAVVALAKDVLGPGGFLLTSLEDATIARVRRAFPTVPVALTLGRDLTGVRGRQRLLTRRGELFPLRRLRACGAERVAVHHRLARLSVLAMCTRHGIGAMVWTVNEEPMMRGLLADPRVDVLITDRPARAAELREDAR